jgi:hypothetical protein
MTFFKNIHPMSYFPGFLLLSGIFYYYFDEKKIYDSMYKKKKSDKSVQTNGKYHSEIGLEEHIENGMEDSIEMLLLH